MKRNLLVVCLLGALAILLGAFGAHSLKESLTIDALKSFETGVKYQMYHVIVLLFVNTTSFLTEKIKNRITILFLAGICFFSGSIYAITFGVDPKMIWFITPLGGLIFILGWLNLGYKLYTCKK
jgi:uncharacterized membrane protein YgdD (TMEM256/DUF423 family)